MSQKASVAVARGEKTIFGREGNIVFGPKHRPMASVSDPHSFNPDPDPDPA